MFARCAEALDTDRAVNLGLLAERLGMAPTVLQRADPGLYAELVAVSAMHQARSSGRARAAERARCRVLVIARLRARIELELTCSAPRSPTSIAGEMDVTVSFIKTHCSAELHRLQMHRRSRRREQLGAIGRLLEEEALRLRPRPLAEFAKAVGVSVSTLKASVPGAVAQHRAAKRRQARFPRTSVHPHGYAPFVAALEAEANASEPRSVLGLARALDTSAVTLANASRPAVERLLAARERALRQRAELDDQRILAVLESEALEAKPRSVRELAQAMGTYPGKFSSVSRKAVEALLAARARSRPSDLELLAALDAEAVADNPRSVAVLARALGTNHQKLLRVSRPALERLVAVRRLK